MLGGIPSLRLWILNMSVGWGYMSYSLNSLKRGHIGDNIGDYYRGYLGGY